MNEGRVVVAGWLIVLHCYGCGLPFMSRATLGEHLSVDGPHGPIRPAPAVGPPSA